MKKNKKNLTYNILMQTILLFVNAFSPLLSGMYVARILSVDIYGTYNYIGSFISVLITAGTLSISTIGLRELSSVEDKKTFNQKFSELFFLRLIFEAVTFTGYFIYIMYCIKSYRIVYIIMLLQMITKVFEVEWALAAKNEFSFITIKTIVIRVMYLLGLFVFVKKPDDIVPYAIVSVFVGLLNESLSFLFIIQKVQLTCHNIRIFRNFKSVLMMTITYNTVLLYGNIDKLFLNNYVGPDSVAYYTISSTISNLILSLVFGIVTGVLPTINHSAKFDRNHYYSLVKKVSDNLFFLAIPMAFGIMLLSKDILFLFAGQKYIEIGGVLVLSSIYSLALKYTEVFENTVMYPNGREKDGLVIFIIFGLLNVIANIVLAYLKILSSYTTILASIVINIGMILTYSFYTKLKIDQKISILSFNQVKYVLFSILFIYVGKLILSKEMAIYYRIICVVLSSVIIYTVLNFITKDESLKNYIHKIQKLLEKIKLRF